LLVLNIETRQPEKGDAGGDPVAGD